jgi:hypothetical protein
MGKKGKGKQAGNFSSKSMRAAFCTELQALANEVEIRSSRSAGRRKKQQSSPPINKERPKFRLTHLQNVLQDRLHEDRVEDRIRRQSRNRNVSLANQKIDSKTTSAIHTQLNTYDGDDDDYREKGLTLLCVKALAPALNEYIMSLGRKKTHSLLSLLPGDTLTSLAIELSTRKLWTNKDVLYVVTHHAHISRLVICLSDSDTKNFTSEDLEEALVLQPSSTWRHRKVPDSWEDDGVWEEEEQLTGIVIRNLNLQRIELRNIPQLSAKAALSLISSSTTHCSLFNTLNPTSGPELVEELIQNQYIFEELVFSHCKWLTNQMLQKLGQTAIKIDDVGAIEP